MPDAETIKLVAQVASTLLALLALFIGLRNEARNQKRFKQQLEQGKKLAESAARPLLSIEREGYEDQKALTLENHGPGTAVVMSVLFRSDSRSAKDLSDLLKVPAEPEIIWNEMTSYGSSPSYVASKSSEDMFRITEERLLECGFSRKRAAETLENIEKQLDNIDVIIKYEDVFGQRFEAQD
jgi:hypothetical protein